MNSRSSNPLQIMLNNKEWILADGATGTNLFNMGLSSGDAPEFWNKSAPKKIKTLYKDSVNAGSDLFLTNSFGGNRSRLQLHGAEKAHWNFHVYQLKLAERWQTRRSGQ